MNNVGASYRPDDPQNRMINICVTGSNLCGNWHLFQASDLGISIRHFFERHHIMAHYVPTMDEIKQALLAKMKGRGENGQRSFGDNASYPFWDMPENGSVTVRFLPDKDPNNKVFWVERQVIRLPFTGIVGGDNPDPNKRIVVQVPCNDMFKERSCPIIKATQHLWNKGKEEKEIARIYYKKRSYILQGFVVDSPIEEANPPENPIRRFVVGPSIHKIIFQSLISDFDESPIDFTGGCDFILRKTKQGQHNNYQTSSFARRSRSLSEAERAAIEKYGLYDLKEFLGTPPDEEHLEVIRALFEDSFNGRPYDMDQYGRYYKPINAREQGEEDDDTLSHARPMNSAAAPAQPKEEKTEESSAKTEAFDIIQKLRNRNKAQSA